VNPLFLGTMQRRIFGIHEPPAAARGPARAAVLCYPWDGEYTYAHRSMRQLAARLSMCGFHTLRFDYFGTGDSGGDPSEADLTGWQSDLDAAVEAVADIAGATRVALIGLRVGANVAASAALRAPARTEALVLWDPVVSGAEYLRELQTTAPINELSATAPRMLRDLQEIDLAPVIEALAVRTLFVATQTLASHEGLTASMGAMRVPMEFVSAPCPWIEAASTSGALPTRVIHRVEEWLR
jgi:pimeloyl-ACP methyl ester carboxylesterase